MKNNLKSKKLTTLATWLLLPILVWQTVVALYCSIIYVSSNVSLSVEFASTGAIYDHDYSQLGDYNDVTDGLIDIQDIVFTDLTQSIIWIAIVTALLVILNFKNRSFLKKLGLFVVGMAVFFLLVALTQPILRGYFVEQAIQSTI